MLLDEVQKSLSRLARTDNYEFISLAAVDTKLHLIDKLFYGIAAKIDWPKQARRFVGTQLHKLGYRVDSAGSRLDFNEIAVQNKLSSAVLSSKLQELLKSTIIDDLDMSIEFRFAAMHLCLAQIYRDGRPLSDLQDGIIGWLTGIVPSVVSLRRASIFQRIGRHNGRHLLHSLAAWNRKCDSNGLLLCLDISRYLEAVKVADRTDGLYYSPANTSDLYEVLRECIDDIDRASGIVILVIAPPAFLEDPRRGIDVYRALKMRVWDDVRVRGHENPVAPLVRLSAWGRVNAR
ncbi:BREX system ATP-binding domain-containing protein [Acidicapsa dinghuensis]